MFEATQKIATASLKTLVPDPLSILPPEDPDSLPFGGNQATLRLFIPDAISDITIVQDYREKGILDRFAVIGGLWTFSCVIFAILFRVSLTRILFNTKPISIFGLAQQIECRAIVAGLFREFSNLETELEAYVRDRGLNSLLTDYLIDIEPLKEHLLEAENQKVTMENAKLP